MTNWWHIDYYSIGHNFYKSIRRPLKKTSQIKDACEGVSVYF